MNKKKRRRSSIRDEHETEMRRACPEVNIHGDGGTHVPHASPPDAVEPCRTRKDVPEETPEEFGKGLEDRGREVFLCVRVRDVRCEGSGGRGEGRGGF